MTESRYHTQLFWSQKYKKKCYFSKAILYNTNSIDFSKKKKTLNQKKKSSNVSTARNSQNILRQIRIINYEVDDLHTQKSIRPNEWRVYSGWKVHRRNSLIPHCAERSADKGLLRNPIRPLYTRVCVCVSFYITRVNRISKFGKNGYK